MKTVGKYTNSFSANIVKGMLKEEGIEAVVLNENVGIITGIINEDLLSIELAVNDEDYEEARRLIEAASSAS